MILEDYNIHKVIYTNMVQIHPYFDSIYEPIIYINMWNYAAKIRERRNK